jgi:Ca2+-binding EF-hand superfamily protein
MGEEEVKQLLLLIDTDKKGKISKQEWMKFMEAEFDRLDKDKSGQLDIKELGAIEIAGEPLQQCRQVTPAVFLVRSAGIRGNPELMSPDWSR